jgi:hypothetical protein
VKPMSTRCDSTISRCFDLVITDRAFHVVVVVVVFIMSYMSILF